MPPCIQFNPFRHPGPRALRVGEMFLDVQLTTLQVDFWMYSKPAAGFSTMNYTNYSTSLRLTCNEPQILNIIGTGLR
jgi:hypothetical protein